MNNLTNRYGLQFNRKLIKDMKGNRRLAAILFTDIVGYSTLISLDEDRAVDYLLDNKNSQKHLVEKFNGITWKDLGDGILATFNTIKECVECAQGIVAQSKKDNRLNLRVGIHLCDVQVLDDDIYGEGVNIASRIMEMAGSNSIYISESAYLTLCNKHGHKVEFKGRKRLRNIPEAVGIYELITETTGKNNNTGNFKDRKTSLVEYLGKIAVWGWLIPIFKLVLISNPSQIQLL